MDGQPRSGGESAGMGLLPPTARVYTVAEITRHVRELLETDELLEGVWVKGEVSNLSRPASGHVYLTLKDAQSQLACVVWRNVAGALNFALKDGMSVLARGRVAVYEVQGRYQLYAEELQPVGVGALFLAFLQLKERLEKEGLFAPEHKVPLPRFPATVGVVTSLTGAAVRDVVRITQRRFPTARVVIRNVRVQGEGAAQEIADAIALFNARKAADVLIVGRGGGSLEDLWAFNEEVVARAIYGSEIPVVSAVGHETDFTIADFVADRRAPTPSAAAEIVVPDRAEILRLLQRDGGIMFRRMQTSVRDAGQRSDEIGLRLLRGARTQVDAASAALGKEAKALESLSPLATLARGYAVARKEGSVVRSVQEVKRGDALEVLLRDGRIRSTVDATEQAREDRP